MEVDGVGTSFDTVESSCDMVVCYGPVPGRLDAVVGDTDLVVEWTVGTGTGALGFADVDGTAYIRLNSGRGMPVAVQVSEESIGSFVVVVNDVNVVVSGETRTGGGQGPLDTPSAMSGMGTGGSSTPNGWTAYGPYGTVGETGYTRANEDEEEVRGRGKYGRSEQHVLVNGAVWTVWWHSIVYDELSASWETFVDASIVKDAPDVVKNGDVAVSASADSPGYMSGRVSVLALSAVDLEAPATGGGSLQVGETAADVI